MAPATYALLRPRRRDGVGDERIGEAARRAKGPSALDLDRPGQGQGPFLHQDRLVCAFSRYWRSWRIRSAHCWRVAQVRWRFSREPTSPSLRQIIWLGSSPGASTRVGTPWRGGGAVAWANAAEAAKAGIVAARRIGLSMSMLLRRIRALIRQGRRQRKAFQPRRRSTAAIAAAIASLWSISLVSIRTASAAMASGAAAR